MQYDELRYEGECKGKGAACTKYTYGTVLGNGFKFIKDIGMDKHGKRVSEFECPLCGQKTKKSLSKVTSEELISCGCFLRGGWSKKKWTDAAERNPNDTPKLYIIRCFDCEEEFVKIGITIKKLGKRLNKGRIPYEYEVIREVKGSANFIWNKEKELHEIFKEYSITPTKEFAGSVKECFSIKILEDVILNT